MRRDRLGFDILTYRIAASPVGLVVGAHKLPPASWPRYADAIAFAGYGRDVADHSDGLVAAFAQEAEDAGRAVTAVNPFKSGRVRISLVEGRFRPVELVKVGHQPLDARVAVVLR